MCKIYNKIGSLSALKSQLEYSKIHSFKSLKEVIDFKNSYTAIRKQLISHHEKLIEQEKIKLKNELEQLEASIQLQKQQSEKQLLEEIENLKQYLRIDTNTTSSFFQKAINYFRVRNWKNKIKQKEINIEIEIKMALSAIVGDYEFKHNRYQFISLHFSEAVRQSVQPHLTELERKKSKIDELNSFIYGALGEQKVVRTLENMSNEHYLINDFTVSFSPAIYNRQENDYIKSVQIDHILVSPAGVFLIETKNWSEKSVENLNLRSPVQQIRRASFVLFKLLNNDLSNYDIIIDRHHWGERKISIKNLIVLMNTKPKQEFQHVKVLKLNELLGYISYFKPIFSISETQKIAEYLISINNLK